MVTGTNWATELIDSAKKAPAYEVKEDDIVSEDGQRIICPVCHEVKRVKTNTRIFGTYWALYNGGCACERKEAEERRKAEERERFLSCWNGEKYQRLVGKRYADKTFDQLVKVDNESYEFVRDRCERYVKASDYALDKGLGIYIFSAQFGNGKTTLLACIRNALLDKQIPAVFIKFSDLIELARDGALEGVQYTDILEVPVLLIDDIGNEDLRRNEARGEWINGILEKIVDYRHSGKLCTCFSSNYALDQLQKIRGYKERTIQRIDEMAPKRYVIQCESFRGKDWKI